MLQPSDRGHLRSVKSVRMDEQKSHHKYRRCNQWLQKCDFYLVQETLENKFFLNFILLFMCV